MRELKKLLLAGAVFLGVTLSGTAGEIISSDFAAPGSGLSIFLASGEENDYTGGEITLSRGSGKIHSRSHFFVYPSQEEGKSWCALLGIPSDLEEGTYTLSCRMDTPEGTVFMQKRVGVSTRDFPAEVLELNTDLTNIRTKEDPVKTAQAQRLWSILASFNEESRYFTGKLVPPMDEYRVTTDYGCRRIYHYNDGTEAGSIHNGWDWAAPTGTPVKAVGRGRVVMAEDRIVTGNTVILELLPGVFMLYYHLDELACKVGDILEPGQMVGTLGMTGLATGPHLHWEMRVSKVAVDPLPFLEGNLIDKTLFIAKMNDTL